MVCSYPKLAGESVRKGRVRPGVLGHPGGLRDRLVDRVAGSQAVPQGAASRRSDVFRRRAQKVHIAPWAASIERFVHWVQSHRSRILRELDIKAPRRRTPALRRSCRSCFGLTTSAAQARFRDGCRCRGASFCSRERTSRNESIRGGSVTYDRARGSKPRCERRRFPACCGNRRLS